MKRFTDLFVALFIFSLVLLFYWPGMMTHDSTDQLNQALTGQYHDLHPPIMAWVWSWMNFPIPGPTGMILFHNLLFFGGVVLFGRHLFTKPLHRALFVLSFGLFPPLFTQLGMVWKDVGLSGSLLLGSGLILHTPKAKRKWLFLGGALLCFFYGLAVRINSIPAVLPLMIWWTYRLPFADNKLSWAKKVALAVLLVLAMSFVRHFMDYQLLQTKRLYPFQMVVLHDLAALSVTTGTLQFPDYALASPTLSISRLWRMFRPSSPEESLGWGEVLPRTNDPLQVRELKRYWLEKVTEHPGDYLRWRWSRLARLLSIGRPTICDPFGWGVAPNVLGIELHETTIQRRYFGFLLKIQNTFFFRGWIYWIFGFLVFAVALLTRRTFRTEVIILSSSSFLFGAAYFFCAPSCEFRYLNWTVLSTLISTVLLIYPFRKMTKEDIKA